MILETFPVGPLQCNCTMMGDEEAREAIVIDPGDEVSRIHRRLTEHGLKLKQILITHAHIDHVGGALKLKALTGAPIYLNENDLPLLGMMAAQAAWIGVPTPDTAPPDEASPKAVASGSTATPPRYSTLQAIPRARSASISSLSRWSSPETHLFAGSIGRTDLPGGNFDQIIESIQTRLLSLPDATTVVPGHGPVTTIGAERKSNPFLQQA